MQQHFIYIYISLSLIEPSYICCVLLCSSTVIGPRGPAVFARGCASALVVGSTAVGKCVVLQRNAAIVRWLVERCSGPFWYVGPHLLELVPEGVNFVTVGHFVALPPGFACIGLGPASGPERHSPAKSPGRLAGRLVF